MERILKRVGNKIKRKRQSLNYSREKLAELSDMSSRSIAKIEEGKQEMGLLTFIKLCNALSITPNYLIDDENINNKQEIIDFLGDCPKTLQPKLKKIVCEILDIYNDYEQ